MSSKTEVLLVEDEPLIAIDVSQKLQQLGYSISAVATRAEEAYLAASATRPDLVLMDINLDGTVDGIEAAARIYSELRIPIVFLTAHNDLQTLRKAQGTDPFGYLTKPATCSDLGNSIEIALQQHSKHKLHKLRELWLETQLLSVGAGLIATSQDGTIRFINPEGERLLGISKAEVVGMAFRSVIPLRDSTTGQTADDFIRLAFLQGGITDIGENFIVKTRGEDRKITGELSIARVEGESIGLVFTFRDSTVRSQDSSSFMAQLPKSEEDCGRARIYLSETLQTSKTSLHSCLSPGSRLRLAAAEETDVPIFGNQTLVKSLVVGLLEYAQECSAKPLCVCISTATLDFTKHNLDGSTARYVRLKVDYQYQHPIRSTIPSPSSNRSLAVSRKAEVSFQKVRNAVVSLQGTMQSAYLDGWVKWSFDFPVADSFEAAGGVLVSATVILVEPDAAVRAVLCDYLNSVGYECWGATDIGEARMWAHSLQEQVKFFVLPEGEDHNEVHALQKEAFSASMVFVTNESQTAMNRKLINGPARAYTIDSRFSKETLRAKLDEVRVAHLRTQLN